MATLKLPKKDSPMTASGDACSVDKLRPVVGGFRGKPYPETKTSGVVIRGTGAATKGRTARGPL